MDFCSENSVSFVPPKADEFELTIFGPGVGECILMHLGDGNWFVIDSCRIPGSKTPAAIAYLEKLKIDPSSAIQSILATHWHDDHVKGLADIVRRCPQATFAMSAALEQAQFFQLVYEANESNKLVEVSSRTSLTISRRQEEKSFPLIFLLLREQLYTWAASMSRSAFKR